MKAISFPEKGKVAHVALDDPRAGDGEVVVDVKASGICHTDIEVLQGNYGTSAFPLVPGHEYAGVVTEIGAGVSGIGIGDRVVVDPNIECGSCRACRRGWAHLCEDLGAYGVTINGGFAERSVVRASSVHPIGDLEFHVAALAEPIGCVLNGLGTVCGETDESALIFGAGPMGLLLAITLRTRGIPEIALVEIDEARLELAEGFGFAAVDANASSLSDMHRSFDLVVDATGAAAVAGKIVEFIANGGKGLFFGVCPADEKIGIAPFEMFRRQITLSGSHSLNHNIPEALGVARALGSDIGRLVSHRMPLQEVAYCLSNGMPAGSLKVQAAGD